MTPRPPVDRALLDAELGIYIDVEDDVRWLPLPAHPEDLAGWPVPHRWQAVLGGPGTAFEMVTALWADLAPFLPRTTAVLTTRLVGLALCSTRERGLSLVYVLDNDGGVDAWRGFPPTDLPEVASRFPVDLAIFYGVHDGLVNLVSDDGGPEPSAGWTVFRHPVTDEADLVRVAGNGPDAFGFDLSGEPVTACSIWPDEESVEIVDDVWAFLDELLAAPFET